MYIAPVTKSYIGPEHCLTGVSAALAQARTMFRQAAPEMSWADVTAEAHRVRGRSPEPMTLLQALQVVQNQIAAGR